MAKVRFGTVLRQVGQLTTRPTATTGDGQLLERFARQRDQEAFAALVERHGRLVLHVCRGVLRHEQDAEDAFQATFLVLARKAGSVRKANSVASWLYGVAYRVALKARAAAVRRRAREQGEADVARDDAAKEVALRDLQAVLDEEINRLPNKLRAPFLLCCLEGKTRPEAARELGWKEGTVAGRLAQARERLRQRLDRRGIALTAALAAVALESTTASAALTTTTVRSAVAFAGGAAAGVSVPVRTLAEGALKTMTLTRGKIAFALFVALAVAGTGTGMALHLGGSDGAPRPTAQSSAPHPANAGRTPAALKDAYGDALPAGSLARFGSTRLRHQHTISALAYSRDGTKLASASWDGSVRLWDTADGRLLALARGDGFSSVDVSPDGRLAAGGDMNRTLTVFEADQVPARVLWKATELENTVIATRFSPNGQWLATASGPVVRVWDAPSGAEIARFRGSDKGVRPLAFSPDGRLLAAGGEDGVIYTWELFGGKERRLVGHKNCLYHLCFSPDGAQLVSSAAEDNWSICLWDVATGREVRRFDGQPDGARPVGFSPDGKLLAAGGRDSTIRLYDVATGALVRAMHLTVPNRTAILSLTFSPDGKRLASAGTEKVIRLWDVVTGQEIHPYAGHENEIRMVAVSRDGKTVVSAGAGGLVCTWDVASHRLLRSFRAGNGISAVAVSADGATLATAADGVVTLWDLATGHERRQLRGHQGGVDAIAFDHGGKLLATGGWGDHTIRLWDLATGTARHFISLPRPKGQNYGDVPLLFTRDDHTLISGSADRTNLSLYFWDPATGKEKRRLDRQASRLALSPDGTLLAVCGWQKAITLLDPATGTEHGRIPADADALAFSPDGRLLAFGGVDGDVHLLDLETRAEQATFHAHQTGRDAKGSFARGVSALVFAPDGRTLVSGGGDTTVLVLEVPR